MTVQEAFEFADKIHFSYQTRMGSDSINFTVLEYLGKEKYFQFCENMKSAPFKKTINSNTIVIMFSKDFSLNPLNVEDIVSDMAIEKQWSIGTITTEIKKLI